MLEIDLVNDDEVNIILEDVANNYGYDFTDYSKASIKRRLNRLCLIDKHKNFAAFRFKILNDPNYLDRFVEEITVNVTEMFRDPSYYRVLRNEIIPQLAKNAHIKIWLAGCSTGEEVYSLAIILLEAGLIHKSMLYATDINPTVLAKAKSGVFPISQIKLYADNYIASGGENDFSSYYSTNYNQVMLRDDLKTNTLFVTHNLVTDRSFNEFQLIICRNVLIYFNKNLQENVLTLFDDSLEDLGYLVLGNKETIRFSRLGPRYTQIQKEKIWRKSNS
jgi:chemotaxis protein methyltransferase CheR